MERVLSCKLCKTCRACVHKNADALFAAAPMILFNSRKQNMQKENDVWNPLQIRETRELCWSLLGFIRKDYLLLRWLMHAMKT